VFGGKGGRSRVGLGGRLMGTPMVGERGKVRHAPGLRNWHAQLSGAPRSFSEHGLGFGELSSYAMQHGGRDGPQPLSLGVGYGIEQTLRPSEAARLRLRCHPCRPHCCSKQ